MSFFYTVQVLRALCLGLNTCFGGVETPKWGVSTPILGSQTPSKWGLNTWCVETHFWVLRPILEVTHFTHFETKKMLRPILIVNRACWELFLESTSGGAGPFLVGEVICLFHSFNDRELGLLNSVKHDSHLTTSYKDFVCTTQGSLRP